MPALLSYLVKAAICLIPFYALYILVLRRLTFFRWNRFYLLVSLALSIIIPLLPFGYASHAMADMPGDGIGAAALTNPAVLKQAAPGDHILSLAGWQAWIAAIYLLGVVVTFCFLIWNLW